MSTQSLTSDVACTPRASRAPFTRLMTMLGVHRERRALRNLDAALLKDIGVTPDQARLESTRPIWDTPVRPF
ncbi:DUF1127 domain-containing protein [Pseudooceanicola marinus]|uniref:DUF1127 domain-containing protein n=1 Tax=Pseudooceanicola marinus TaxID=396013 RepID=UPI001CD7F945|nr:DUF1127 domain-containing protein [Pseudooceanicola marinus]MCA1337310.1 DUF1127 domain-containing protein [Pseudooceanicola marinus]